VGKLDEAQLKTYLRFNGCGKDAVRDPPPARRVSWDSWGTLHCGTRRCVYRGAWARVTPARHARCSPPQAGGDYLKMLLQWQRPSQLVLDPAGIPEPVPPSGWGTRRLGLLAWLPAAPRRLARSFLLRAARECVG
jgi:hypothetical protein